MKTFILFIFGMFEDHEDIEYFCNGILTESPTINSVRYVIENSQNIIVIFDSDRDYKTISQDLYALLINDTVGGISFNATTAANSTTAGSSVGYINTQMLENATGSARGSLMSFGTVPTGSTTLSPRLYLNAAGNVYFSDNHAFKSASGATTALTIETASVTIPSGVPLNLGISVTNTVQSTGNTGTTPILVGSFATAAYTAAKFVVSIVDSTNVHSAEVMLTSNGSSTSNTVYATVTVGSGVLGTFSSSLSGGFARLFFTPTGATSMTVKSQQTTI
jgi:hypothetical protein